MKTLSLLYITALYIQYTTACNSGFYNDATTGCTICPEYSYCPDGTTPIPCANSIISACQQTLQSCPVGYSCTSTGYTPVPCTGTLQYNDGTTLTCNTCGAGNYITNNTACTSCSSGDYCPGDGNQYSCPFGSTCNAGTIAPAGYDVSTYGNATLCGIATINNGSYTSCQAVPGGYYTSTYIQQGYAPNGGVNSSICPAGSFCPADGDMYACSTYSITTCSDTTGLVCAPGYDCTAIHSLALAGNSVSNIQPQPCSAGSYNDGSTVSCQTCPDGSICNGATISSCPTGQVSYNGITCVNSTVAPTTATPTIVPTTTPATAVTIQINPNPINGSNSIQQTMGSSDSCQIGGSIVTIALSVVLCMTL